MGIGYLPPFTGQRPPGRRRFSRNEMEMRMRSGKKHGKRYPWARWFRMKKFRIRFGKEYTCRSDMMASHIRRMASRYGIDVEIKIAAAMMSITVIVKGSKPMNTSR
jgi:hypothetical protein